jgi:hypothetical protein
MGVFLPAFAVLNAVILGFHVALAIGLFVNLRGEAEGERGQGWP